MEAIGMDVDLPTVEPIEIFSPKDRIEVMGMNTDVEMMEVDEIGNKMNADEVQMMEVDEIGDKMQVDEDVQDVRQVLGNGMNTQQKIQVSPFLRAECCANIEMKCRTENVNVVKESITLTVNFKIQR